MINDKLNLFSSVSLNKNSPVPIYYQLQQVIQNLINSNKIKEGEQLPTEEEICKLFNISRMTVRQTYDNLLRMELIYRLKGKGTFVSSKKIIFELSKLHSFSEDMKKRGLKVYSKVLEKRITRLDKAVKAKFHIPGNLKLLRIKRLRFVQHDPIALESSLIPVKMCPGLEKEDLARKSLFQILEKKYKLYISHSNQSIEPVLSDKVESSLLNIKIGSPLIRMTGTTYLKNNIPIEYIIGVYRGDRYKFNLYLKR